MGETWTGRCQAIPRALAGITLGLVSLASLHCVPLAAFPEVSPTVVLPMRDPITRPDPSVLVTLPGQDGPMSVWMYPDTGAAHVTVQPGWLARLGPHFDPRGEDKLGWIEGPAERSTYGVLSTFGLGDLVVRDVYAWTSGPPHLPLIGQSILAHSPWEIDWDKGTLTLGARPWPEAPDTIVVPLRRVDGKKDVVSVYVDGHPIDMILDTGALFSMIGVDVGMRAGLADQPGDDKRPGGAREIVGEVTLGALSLGRVHFASGPPFRRDMTALGLDVLSRFWVHVVPGKELRLRRRGDAWDSASARVARWPWTRACASTPCIRGHLEPAGDDVRLTVSFDLDAPQAIEVLLGCREADARALEPTTVAQVLGSGRRSMPLRHVRVRVASATRGSGFDTVVQRKGFWGTMADKCPELAALDVVPIDAERLAGKAFSVRP